MRRKTRRLAVFAAAAAAVALTTTTFGAPAEGERRRGVMATPRVVVDELDNPRQLTLLPDGRLLVALAGRGGDTSKLGVIKDGHVRYVMRGFPSFADADGSFAVGLNGASKRPGGAFYALSTPQSAPLGQRRDVWLLAKQPGGQVHKVANVGRYERRHDPDGEGVESNPYSALALDDRILVADAAGDYIAQVRHGHVREWAVMPEYGPRVDAVPTVIAQGADGMIYVGELHSEQRRKAKVWKFSEDGDRMRSWKGFTTVTGVARTADGTLYVSELFGGSCDFDEIPNCFPGRVVKIDPDAGRSHVDVPFPAGIAARGDHVWVSAFSIAPGTGVFGNPEWDGQVWHIKT